MCSTYTLDQIRPHVDAKVAARALFTSVDISRLMPGVAHREVRDGVRQLWSGGSLSAQGYDRTLERMANGEQAYVYHPQGVSASSYSDRGQAAGTTPGFSQNTGFGSTPAALPSLASAPSAPSGAPVAVSASVSDSDRIDRNVRSDGAVEISASFVESVKRPYQDTLFGSLDAANKTIVIAGKETTDSCKISVYSNGSARIPKRLIEKYETLVNSSFREFTLRRSGGTLTLTGK